jgi:hypothetical protein
MGIYTNHVLGNLNMNINEMEYKKFESIEILISK